MGDSNSKNPIQFRSPVTREEEIPNSPVPLGEEDEQEEKKEETKKDDGDVENIKDEDLETLTPLLYTKQTGKAYSAYVFNLPYTSASKSEQKALSTIDAFLEKKVKNGELANSREAYDAQIKKYIKLADASELPTRGKIAAVVEFIKYLGRRYAKNT